MTEAWLEVLDVETCKRLLRENAVGRIAVVADDFPIVLPVNYRVVESSDANWPRCVLARAACSIAGRSRSPSKSTPLIRAITRAGQCSSADTCSAWIPTRPTFARGLILNHGLPTNVTLGL